MKKEALEFKKFIKKLNKDVPLLICLWIQSVCKKAKPNSSSQLLRESENRTQLHTQKMHTAVSYFYTHKVCLKSDYFSKKSNGEWTGNPTLLNIMARYIRSLHRQKVCCFLGNTNIYLQFTITNAILQTRAGETQESIKAITTLKLQELYKYNASLKYTSQLSRLPTGQGGRIQGGVHQRIIMSLMYAIAFTCFLRFNKVLCIKVWHIQIHDLATRKVELTLNFQKIY